MAFFEFILVDTAVAGKMREFYRRLKRVGRSELITQVVDALNICSDQEQSFSQNVFEYGVRKMSWSKSDLFFFLAQQIAGQRKKMTISLNIQCAYSL